MKVRATKMGFHDGTRVREGEEFEFEGKKLASWMEKVEEAKKPRAKKEDKEPESFSELNKQNEAAEKKLDA